MLNVMVFQKGYIYPKIFLGTFVILSLLDQK